MIIHNRAVTPNARAKPHFSPSPGTHVFIPQMDATIEGIEIISVIEVKTFITTFKLFEMIEANASIVPLRMSL